MLWQLLVHSYQQSTRAAAATEGAVTMPYDYVVAGSIGVLIHRRRPGEVGPDCKAGCSRVSRYCRFCSAPRSASHSQYGTWADDDIAASSQGPVAALGRAVGLATRLNKVCGAVHLHSHPHT